MKKLISVLMGALVAFSLFTVTGTPVKAASSIELLTSAATGSADDGCGCHDLKPLTGAERNKIVAKLISSDAFKVKKLELIHQGYKWNGAKAIEVVIPAEGMTMAGASFTSADGVTIMVVFINGQFAGQAPIE